ncbi:hypothetical protein ACFVUW_10285 [Streptomyces xiamenensis]|uniref:hypothetical protein n=1 Tax=Streptomyces xiamenensis TaxID=408015 RepID=UPI0036ED6504
MAPSDLPCWIPPPEYGVSRVPCAGRFAAVVLPRPVGELLLKAAPSRGVIVDVAADVLVWLVPPGSLTTDAVPGASLLGPGDAVHVPPAEWRRWEPVRWVVPPRGDCLAEPAVLSSALRRLSGRVCVCCGVLPERPAVITGAAADGQCVSLTSCQLHADEVTEALEYAAEVAEAARVSA